MTLLLFSEALHSLSAGERCFGEQRNVSYYYFNELVDFSFILEELKTKYCLDNGRNAIPPIRMFKYLLLKAINDVSDLDLVERSKYDMSSWIWHQKIQ